MAPRRPRRHHYQPQFYLAGFTDAGRPRGGRLSIVDVDSGEQHTGLTSMNDGSDSAHPPNDAADPPA
jgi:hypothetical protein